MKNFLSIGAVPQTIDISKSGLSLVLGENLDVEGDDTKNGTGKTSLISAISYSLFDQAITNIKKDNLINAINKKNMEVSIEFEKNGIIYRIERGRKPNFTRFIVNDSWVNKDTDEAQGENKETQKEIENVIGMSHIMFKHIIALNTYTDPFLSMPVSKQRELIEELLGITLLSHKADKLKELIKVTKSRIEQEELMNAY